MALMDEAARTLAASAGWKLPNPEKDGTYRFRLQGELDFDLFSPDGRVCIMRGEVASLPVDGSGREDALARAARMQVGVCRSRPSVLAVEGPGRDRLVLYRQVRLETGRSDALVGEVRDFLNDFDWWRAAWGGGSGPAPTFGLPAMGTGIWMGSPR